MKKEHQINFWYVVVALLGILIVQAYLVQLQKVEHIPYSEFRSLLESGKISEVVVGDTTIRGKLTTPKDQRSEFVTNKMSPELADYLAKYNIKYSAEPDATWLTTLLSWVVPTLLFVGIWMFAIRRMAGGADGMGGGLLAIGKSKARVYLEKQTGVTFADVAGVDEAKEELQEIVDFLKNPAEHSRLGARMPKGILLVGPPGTGKTLLARAVAGEAGVPFFTIGGSEFVEMFVGVGAARVRDLFEQARQHAPCIIFIDELDALGRARGTFALGGHDEKEQTLNQLLAELDGFDPRVGIVLLAATNRPETLDPALLRAGRFDRQVLVDRPDKKGRSDILAIYLRKVKLARDIDVERVAALTPGFTGADLANLVNEAALLATRRGAKSVALDDFTQAIERVIAGLEKRNRVLIPHEREVIAFHETGHALVAMALPGMDPVQKVSIIPRGVAALGYTMQRPIEDRFLMDRIELERKLAVLLGGRAAETLTFAAVSTGAADDLQKATDIARSMVARFGMVAELGQVSYEGESSHFLTPVPGMMPPPRWYSEVTAAKIDAAIKEIVEAAFAQARAILVANRALLDEMAHALLAQETLAGPDLEALAARVKVERASDPGARPG
ncbi:membrane protease FtsH catalytic subunit [Enhydrobacter aerosaccus]|uniref:ATP-dependent zinc metalloprotease FtsH n=1 Tax=Enhydrobacter aerosaccus TaxID=225324 RepID=A0A1T4R9B2_9HYPH|nr:ATP-dependent zinc metalloprotease FtsH [Enhydrobacter aerosaccus]SKA12602.1 membrane protease FtsH catalytic subunit [Enhydrobacter aerosaccus]